MTDKTTITPEQRELTNKIKKLGEENEKLRNNLEKLKRENETIWGIVQELQNITQFLNKYKGDQK